MDYLITNGYPAAAKKFAVEANIQPKADAESIQARVEIRTAIHSGNIQSAIEKINELNPQVRKIYPSPSPPSPVARIIPVSCTTHNWTLRGLDDKQTSSVLSMNSNNSVSLSSLKSFAES